MDPMDYTMEDAGNPVNSGGNNPTARYQCLPSSAPAAAQHGYASQGHFDPVHDASNYYYGLNANTSSRPSYPQNQHMHNWNVAPYMPPAGWQGFGDMLRPTPTQGGPDSFVHRGPGRNYEDMSWSGYRPHARVDDTYGPFSNQLSGHNLPADISMGPGGIGQGGSASQTSNLRPSPFMQNFDRPPPPIELPPQSGPSHNRVPSLATSHANRHPNQMPSHPFPMPPDTDSSRYQRSSRVSPSRLARFANRLSGRLSWAESDEESVSDMEDEAIRREVTSYREHAEEHALMMQGAAAAGRKILAKEAFESLEKLKAEDLPRESKDCTICYNDFGLENPDGIVEQPVRWPKCKHLFGDKCIQRWFEEGKDTCPYCREKIPSESASKRLSTESQIRTLQRRRVLQAVTAGQQPARHGAPSTPGVLPEDSTSRRIPLTQQFSRSHEEYDAMVGHNAESWTYSSQHRYSPGDSPERRRQGRGRSSAGRPGHHMGRPVSIGSARSVNQSFSVHHNPPQRNFGPSLPSLHTPASARRTSPPVASTTQGNPRQAHTQPQTPQARASAAPSSSPSASPEEASPPVAVGSGLPARQRFGSNHPNFSDLQNPHLDGQRTNQRFWDEANALEQRINALSQSALSANIPRRESESTSRTPTEASQTFANP